MSDTLDTLLSESRHFPPSAEFTSSARVSDPDIYDQALADSLAYWEGWAKKLDWFEPWQEVLHWELPHAQWFVGGKLNACYNCVDRHVVQGRGDRVAIVWEGEPGDVQTITYAEL